MNRIPHYVQHTAKLMVCTHSQLVVLCIIRMLTPANRHIRHHIALDMNNREPTQ